MPSSSSSEEHHETPAAEVDADLPEPVPGPDLLAAVGEGDSDEDGEPSVAPSAAPAATPPVTPQPPAAEPAKPAAEPPAKPAEPAKPTEPPTEKKEEAKPAQPTEPVTPKPAPAAASLDEEWNKIRKEGIDTLVKHYEGMVDDKVKETFGEEAAKEIPRLLAPVHMNIFENVMNAVHAAIPEIIRGIQAQDTAKTAFEDKFYGMFPALKEFPADVLKAAQMYHSLNPSVPAEQLIKDVGLSLSVSKKLALPAGLVTPPPPVPPADPATKPFVPAAAGAAGAPPVAPAKGRFEQLILDEEDQT